jgi:hypothetical protein
LRLALNARGYEMKNQQNVSKKASNLSFIYDKIRPNMKQAKRINQIVGYGRGKERFLLME